MRDLLHAWLTTLRPDGSPHTTPVWFVLEGDNLWFASAMTNVEVRNLKTDPRVSVALDSSGPSPWVVEGNASLHQVERRQDVTHQFKVKYEWDPSDEAHDGRRVLIEVKIDRWLLRPPGFRLTLAADPSAD